ncbi:MAG: DNA polymerase III subunit delta' [Ktedonobacterales bacterium]|nr:DNA polymerase III subunit delta' [Ktedonobacterales bacterium]
MREVVGNRQARALLERAALADAVRHAYLLTGPEGVGKTTLAWAFARLLVCERRAPSSAEACGVCAACHKLAHGNHPDVLLVEPPPGTRFLPVESVREVLRSANLAPSEGRWRIFILPRVERLLPAAANALLKTLEEPPPGVVLLLTSAEPEALLATILSRCQLVPLGPLALEEIVEALEAHWAVAPAEARELAALANGRLGWAVRAHEHPELREQRAERLGQLAALVPANRDQRLRQAGVLGSDMESARYTLEVWMLWWRDVVLAACGATHLATTGAARGEAERQGRALGEERARAFMESLFAARTALDANANPRLTLEVLMLDLPTLGGAEAER